METYRKAWQLFHSGTINKNELIHRLSTIIPEQVQSK